MAVRCLVRSVALWALLLLPWSVSAAPPLAIDVALTPSGVAVPERSSFDPDGPAGWRMADRFRAFRFALSVPSEGDEPREAFMTRVTALARDHKCFGWIQQTTPTRVAGEARCPMRSAPALEAHLRENGEQLELLDYATSKIRYHFPRFRVLDEPKYQGKTCFATPPHACGSSSENSRQKTSSSTERRAV